MRTTLDLDQKAHRLVKAIAASRGVSMGSVVNEAVLSRYAPEEETALTIETSRIGWPVIRTGRLITPEDVAEALDE